MSDEYPLALHDERRERGEIRMVTGCNSGRTPDEFRLVR